MMKKATNLDTQNRNGVGVLNSTKEVDQIVKTGNEFYKNSKWIKGGVARYTSWKKDIK